MKTIAEAAKLLCPVMTRHGGAINCEGAFCMAWRWADPEPAAPFSDWVFAEFGDETGEGTPEPPRPETVPAHWDWVPVSVEGEGDDAEYSGGYWEEPEVDRAKREAAVIAARRGFCGMVGAA